VKKLILFCLLFVSVLSIFATHNRAGEISYKHVSGLTYEVTVTIFADPLSVAISRKEIEINWGDNTGLDSIVITPPEVEIVKDKVVRRKWISQHTFPGPGNYLISVTDRNRNGGVANISNSSSVPFYLESRLRIFPVANIINSSPVLLNDPVDDACVGSTFIHNPGAVDSDGDSLVYSLSESLGLSGTVAPGYSFPPASSRFEINTNTGDLIWENPTLPGIYNVAIRIIEYRNGLYMGEILRDIQIEVYSGCNNDPPIISMNPYICFEAGLTVNPTIQGSDQNLQDKVNLTFTGEIFQESIVSNKAIIVDGFIGNPITSSIIWNTSCDDIRENPYTYSVKAVDDANSRQSSIPNLTTFTTGSLRVVGPSVKGFSSISLGKEIVLDWQKSICNNANGYKIYRRKDSSKFVPTSCQVGVPGNIEYELIETIADPNIITYSDNDDGNGLVPGQAYCYLITAIFNNDEEGYASIEVCSQVEKYIPVITKVDVINTDDGLGQIGLSWSPPSELDAISFPAPYKYLVYQEGVLIDSTPSLADTNLIVEKLFTKSTQYSYSVEFISLGIDRESVGVSTMASSIFLNSSPIDNGVSLNWGVSAPWNNQKFIIYRSTDKTVPFDSIAETNLQSFIDTGLTNGVEYCYYIESIGDYNLTSVISPIINKSQISCSIPIDIDPPCSPILEINSDCINEELELTWTNPNLTCIENQDAIEYNIYRSDSFFGELKLIETIRSINITQFNGQVESVAGCYLVSALDSAENESLNTNRTCIEYCPYYELPNVFTPNGDGFNDLFVPIDYPNFRDVESVEMNIFNRWGEKVFETKNPEILWDGTHQFISKTLPQANDLLGNGRVKVSAGLYFYTCIVNEISLEGIKSRVIKGSVMLIDPQANRIR
jgi:gliding motility-associated-like protein